MEIKSVTLEKSCENMPRQSCFEKPRSCWYDCLCVCGHGIMISLVIVKCDLHSSALCDSRLILPQSARRNSRVPSLAHVQGATESSRRPRSYLPVRNGSEAPGSLLSQLCGTRAHLSCSGDSSACTHAFEAAMLAHMWYYKPVRLAETQLFWCVFFFLCALIWLLQLPGKRKKKRHDCRLKPWAWGLHQVLCRQTTLQANTEPVCCLLIDSRLLITVKSLLYQIYPDVCTF